jgi:O-acetyl-ADP-ribose deacetylase (regulator of RNase III)
VVTGGGRLKARHVIHAVGPVWHGGNRGEDDLLRGAYISSLRLALSVAARSLAFPSISTGAYGFPIERAARIAFDTVREQVQEPCGLDEVRFVTFSRGDRLVYARLFDST